jgi:hypothetical protein
MKNAEKHADYGKIPAPINQECGIINKEKERIRRAVYAV